MENKIMPGGFDFFYLDRGEIELGKLIEQLKQRRAVAVLGESGSGKSVFIKETLRKKLEAGGISGTRGNSWRIVVTSPGSDPVEQLATDLISAGETALHQYSGSEEISRRDELCRAIRTEINPIGQLYQQVLVRSEAPFNLLLVVDDLEDLVRYAGLARDDNHNKGDDVLFVSAILAAMRGKDSVYVVLSTDVRYVSAFSRYRGLPETINNNRFYLNLPAPDDIRTGLRKAMAFPEPVRSTIADKLSLDYGQLCQHDIFALEKLQFLFRLGSGKLTVGDRTYLPEEFLAEYAYKNVLTDIIEQYMEHVVMRDLDEAEIVWLSIIFKALTEQRADGVWRRPVTMRDLMRLLAPHYHQGEPDAAFVVGLIRRINCIGYPLIHILGVNQYSRGNIVTISHDAVLFNWPSLAKWMKEEASHAEVYRLLVRKADQYFGAVFSSEAASYFPGETSTGHAERSLTDMWKYAFSSKPQPDPASHNQYLSEGAELTGAIEWFEVCKPGRAWAARYDDASFVHKNPLSPQFRAVFHDSNPADVAQIDIATQFLSLSRERAEGLIDRLKRETQVALQQRKISRIMTVVATIAMIVSLFFMNEARSDKMDLELLDFLSVLSNNGVLYVLPSQRDNLRREISAAVAKGSTVHSKDDLLNMLIEKKLLQLEPDHPYYEETLDVLKNMHYIHGQTFSESEKKKAQIEVLRLYDKILSVEYADGRWQHPALYYNLNARRDDAEKRLGVNQHIFEKANVVGSAIAPNLLNFHEYAYGDANGKVYVRDQNESFVVSIIGSPILSLVYGSNEEKLFAATAEGVLAEISQIRKGEKVDADTLFADPYFRPIFGIGNFDGDSRFLLMMASELFFIQREPGGSKFVRTGFSKKVEQNRVSSFDLSDDNRFLVVTGLNFTILYELNYEGAGSLTERARILHPGITMTDVAIKRSISGDKFWIALGGEDGRLWISTEVNKIMVESVVNIKAPEFHLFPTAHESTITALEFNPGLPQLFSASIFGEARLWNLYRLPYNDDHISLRNTGRGITAAIYNNENELIIHEVIYGKRVLTNIRAVRAELDLLLEKLK